MTVNWGSLVVLIIIAGWLGHTVAALAPEVQLLPAIVCAAYGWLHAMSWPVFIRK